MSRLLALLAVAVIAFACAPRPLTVAPVEPLGEPADADEPLLVDRNYEVYVTDRTETVGCWEPDPDRLDRLILDEMATADRIGPPLRPDPDDYPAPPKRETPLHPSWHDPRGRSLRENGGDVDSERAVARGLAWLARQQKPDGEWVFGQGENADRVGATGFALLAYLAAGETHQPRDGANTKYQRIVTVGLGWLIKQCPLSGPNAGRMSTDRTAQAVATLALSEAYGRTSDPILKPYAQAALNYLQKAQGPNGSWGDDAGTDGDIFAAGWALQALHAGRLARDLVVDDRVIKTAGKFLDRVSAGDRKAMFGVASSADAKPGTTATAIGLLCRYTFDGWGPNHPGMADGVSGLAKNPPSDANRDPVYLYYATQVLFRYGGGDWKDWNEGPKVAEDFRKGGVRDLLVKSQSRKDGANLGSWEPDAGAFGTRYGRLGTTALTVLTLETYYRHPPPPKIAPAGK